MQKSAWSPILKIADVIAIVAFIGIIIAIESNHLWIISNNLDMMRQGYIGGIGWFLNPAMLIILVLCIAIAWVVAVLKLYKAAKARGSATAGLLLIGFLATPITMALVVIASPALPARPDQAILGQATANQTVSMPAPQQTPTFHGV